MTRTPASSCTAGQVRAALAESLAEPMRRDARIIHPSARVAASRGSPAAASLSQRNAYPLSFYVAVTPFVVDRM